MIRLTRALWNSAKGRGRVGGEGARAERRLSFKKSPVYALLKSSERTREREREKLLQYMGTLPECVQKAKI